MSPLLYYAAVVMAFNATDGATCAFRGKLLDRPSWSIAPLYTFCCHTAWIMFWSLVVGGFFIKPWWGILASIPAAIFVGLVVLGDMARFEKVIPCWFLSVGCLIGWALT